MKNALEQIQQITEALQKVALFAQDNGTTLAGLVEGLDKLCFDHSVFGSFSALVHAPKNYAPTFAKLKGETQIAYRLPCGRIISPAQYFAELDLLALCYDMAQEARGDSRRAFRS